MIRALSWTPHAPAGREQEFVESVDGPAVVYYFFVFRAELLGLPAEMENQTGRFGLAPNAFHGIPFPKTF